MVGIQVGRGILAVVGIQVEKGILQQKGILAAVGMIVAEMIEVEMLLLKDTQVVVEGSHHFEGSLARDREHSRFLVVHNVLVKVDVIMEAKIKNKI